MIDRIRRRSDTFLRGLIRPRLPSSPDGQCQRDTVAPLARRSLTVHLLAAQLIVGATALIINVLAARALEPAGRGELALGIQLSYLLSVLVLLGADRAYPVVADGKVDQAHALDDLGRLLRAPAAVVLLSCIAAGFALAWTFPQALLYAIGVALLALAASAVVAVRAAAIASLRSGPYMAAVVASQTLLLLICISLLVIQEREPLWWIFAYGGCTAVPVATIVARRWRLRCQGTPD